MTFIKFKDYWFNANYIVEITETIAKGRPCVQLKLLPELDYDIELYELEDVNALCAATNYQPKYNYYDSSSK